MKISHFLSFILISSIESKSNVTTIKKSKKTSYSFSSKKKSTSSSRNSSVHSGGARGPKTGAGTLAVRETARKLMGAFSGKVLKEHFYHGPDVSRAMVMRPPCWNVSQSPLTEQTRTNMSEPGRRPGTVGNEQHFLQALCSRKNI